ncbi:MAG: YgiT-type zinc finger protein [Aggregatilineales bacterium]
MNDQLCRLCDGHLQNQKITRLERFDGHWVLVENVPALVCEQCGEIYYTPQAHDLVLDAVTSKQPTRTEQIEVYDAEESA